MRTELNLHDKTQDQIYDEVMNFKNHYPTMFIDGMTVSQHSAVKQFRYRDVSLIEKVWKAKGKKNHA